MVLETHTHKLTLTPDIPIEDVIQRDRQGVCLWFNQDNIPEQPSLREQLLIRRKGTTLPELMFMKRLQVLVVN